MTKQVGKEKTHPDSFPKLSLQAISSLKAKSDHVHRIEFFAHVGR